MTKQEPHFCMCGANEDHVVETILGADDYILCATVWSDGVITKHPIPCRGVFLPVCYSTAKIPTFRQIRNSMYHNPQLWYSVFHSAFLLRQFGIEVCRHAKLIINCQLSIINCKRLFYMYNKSIFEMPFFPFFCSESHKTGYFGL